MLDSPIQRLIPKAEDLLRMSFEQLAPIFLNLAYEQRQQAGFIGAVIAMRVQDYFTKGKRWRGRLHEKGGEMPAHHKLEAYLDEYIRAAGIGDEPKSFLFRSARGRTSEAMHRVDAWRMIQRRAAELGLKVKIGCHTFRATGITAYLEAGGTLENAQAMAAHESPRTTKLYDRTGDEITLDEVERITI